MISQNDIRMQELMAKAKTHFGKDQLSRQEVIAFQESVGQKFPAKFWQEKRIGRGMFSMDTEPVAEPKQFLITNQHKPVKQHTVSKFSYDAMIPVLDDTFVEWGNFKVLDSLIKTNEFFTLYITGDSGSGKNVMVSQVCAKNKKPVVRVSITRETKEEHLIGSKTLVDGSIVYEEGPVKWAAENGAVLILDEISTGDPNELMCLQNILEGKPFFVKAANVMVTPKEGFCIIATDNTKGRGSDSGRWIGTNVLNDAFLERFEMTMEQTYPNEATERKIINKLMDKLGIDDKAFADKLIAWVHAIRKTYEVEGLEEHITTRRACHIVSVYKKLKKADLAIELCVNRFDETTKAAMLSLWEKITVSPEVKTEEVTE